MTFNEHVDTWFDKLAEEQLTDRCRAEFRDVLASVQNRENLRRLRDAADTLSADASIPLVAHIDAITGDEFTGEFLLTYSEQSGEVSAASELFSLVRQALDYEEHP